MTRVKQKCEDIKLGFAWEMGQEPLQSDNQFPIGTLRPSPNQARITEQTERCSELSVLSVRLTTDPGAVSLCIRSRRS